MLLSVRSVLIAFACFAASSSAVLAQLPVARLHAAFPAGGKVGSTFDLTLTSGLDLDGVTRLHFSHPGIKATPKTASGQPAPANTFSVTIAADVPPGTYELRAVGMYGISNPRAFVVGSQNEILETEPNNTPTEAQAVPLNTTVNGRSDAENLDLFKVTLQKGQRVVVDCLAHRIDSRMDATLAMYDPAGNQVGSSRDVNRRDPLLVVTAPVDGDYTIKLYDFLYKGGDQHFYRLTIGTQPHVDFIFPPAGLPGTKGKYTLFGRNLPGGVPDPVVLVAGSPLEKLEVEIEIPAGPTASQLKRDVLVEPGDSMLDGVDYRLHAPQGPSNPVLLGVATAPIVVEQEPNNEPAKAQAVNAPCEVVGQFNPRRDLDWFTFPVKKGESYTVEVFAERLGVSVDPFLVVERVTKDDKGVEKVSDSKEMDDTAVNLGGGAFNTSSEDPSYSFTAFEDGLQRVMVRELNNGLRGDPRFVYRLSIRTARPDFRLVAVPRYRGTGDNENQAQAWNPLLRRGGTEAYDVFAFRRDNFDGEIAVSIEGLPAGVTSPGAILGSGDSATTLVLTAADNAAEWAGPIKIIGKAKVGGADVAQEARGGAVIWEGNNQNNQNTPARARMARDLTLAVSGGETAPFLVTAGDNVVYEASRAGKLSIPIKVTRRGDFKGNLKLKASGLPKGYKGKEMDVAAGAAEGKWEVDIDENAPLGTFTVTLDAASNMNYARNPAAAQAAEAAKKDAEKMVADATTAAKQADMAKAAADKANTEAAAAAKSAADKLQQATQAAAAKPGEAALAQAKVDAEKAAAEAQGKAKAAADAKAAAEKAAMEAAAKVKAAQDMKTAADQKAKQAAETAKPKDTKFSLCTMPVTVKITAAPINVAPPKAGGPLKQGGKIEVPIAITRSQNYAEAIEVVLDKADGVGGLKAEKLTIAAGQSQGNLVLSAGDNAAVGAHQLTVRANVKYNNKTLKVEQPLALIIEKK